MQIAMVAAGFTAGEADQLRRAMAAWKRKGGLEPFEQKLKDGMRSRGYSEDFAQRIYQQIKGFGDYGFPESHSASFALLVYVSAWLKCHHPDAFLAALLNSQPMGFYAPAQLVRDARAAGRRVVTIPGPSAAIAALTLAGLPTELFDRGVFAPLLLTLKLLLRLALEEIGDSGAEAWIGDPLVSTEIHQAQRMRERRRVRTV